MKYSMDYHFHTADGLHIIYSKHSIKHLEDSISTRRRLQRYSTPAVLDYEELGSLSDPGIEYSRISDIT